MWGEGWGTHTGAGNPTEETHKCLLFEMAEAGLAREHAGCSFSTDKVMFAA